MIKEIRSFAADLEIPLLRTIFYLLNWVEAGLKTPSSGIKLRVKWEAAQD
jgi:hypothetical protein